MHNSSYGAEYDRGEGEDVIRARRIDLGVALRDRTTGRTYEQFTYSNTTNIFLKQLRDRNPDVNVLGFRILSGSNLMNFVSNYGSPDCNYAEIQKQWKKEKSAVIKVLQDSLNSMLSTTKHLTMIQSSL